MDEKLLRKVLGNLLSNAVKYSPPGSTVHVDLECDEQITRIYIKDEGIGIPDKDRERLFEPFHRASNVGRVDGTGLGLTIVKQAVEMHGGSIMVENQIGVGTTFIITFPRSRA